MESELRHSLFKVRSPPFVVIVSQFIDSELASFLSSSFQMLQWIQGSGIQSFNLNIAIEIGIEYTVGVGLDSIRETAIINRNWSSGLDIESKIYSLKSEQSSC